MSIKKISNIILKERRLPYRIKHKLGFLGVLPNYLIIGTQKGGTTSLYSYLNQHDCVVAPDMREIHYFSNNFYKGINWYKAHFPAYLVKYCDRNLAKKNFITGESSPSYLLYPHAAERVHKTIPDLKIIALLRNPVDRAYSHYKMMYRRGFETLSFTEAIEAEQSRIKNQWHEVLANKNSCPDIYSDLFLFSYAFRGRYLECLKPWFNLFARKQILILKSEDLYSNPQQTYSQVLNFLDLPRPTIPVNFKNFNPAPQKNSLDIEIRKKLNKHFESFNNELSEFLHRDFSWEK